MFLLAAVALFQMELQSLPLIPWPSHVEVKDGSFTLDASTTLVAKGRETQENADFLRHSLRSSGLSLKGSSQQSKSSILLRIVKPDEALGEEGYRLSVDKSKVDIEAATSAGLFYGIQTFRQLFPATAPL